MDTTDQPSSICHIQPIQMYTLRPPSPNKSPPFNLSAGEMEIHSGTSVDGVIVVTNYRLYLQIGSNQHHIPLGLIESAEHKDLSYLQIGCKDARTYRCTFENNESCMEWYDRIQKAAETPKQIEQLFAFYHYVWTKEKDGFGIARYNDRYDTFDKRMFENEMTRLQFEGHSWRISKVNENYKLCPSYPPYLLVPSCINDEMLESVAKFRSSRRIPAAVWRHTKNGAVIARCSQPEVGWLGWRSSEDEDLIKAISEACNFDRNFSKTNDKESNLSHSPGSLNSDESLHHISSPSQPQQEKKVLIMDARSYTTAVANRARGGGCECPEYYPNCEIEFMNLANIHSIRKSFHALRNLCMTSDQPNWFSQLEGTRWLLHMSGLMKAALTLVTAVERDARPVLVHCSDGWDRTPQIVALAELMLDPYFRTFDGFRILIEREWLAFGHKFADRCGHSSGSDDQNERCPVFLQWLDCVHQLLIQYPCAFEFTQLYLVKLAQHTYSNFFGTFLCNTQQERSKLIYGKTFSVWEFLNTPSFRNHLYCSIRNKCGRKVLWPQCNVRNLYLWAEIYLGSMEANFSAEGGSGSCPGPPETSPHHNSMTKTRSFGDLNNAGEVSASMFRRSSDPNINNNSDKKLNDLASSDDLPQEVMTNGRNHSLDQELDEVECNNDCIFKNSSQTLTDDQIDGLDLADFKSIETTSTKTDDEQSMFSELVINGGDTKTDLRNDDCELVDVRKKSICLISDDALKKAGDINSNCNNSVFGGSNGAICDSNCGDRFEKSVETSTETLVSENNFIISTPKEIVNGLENAADECDSINGSNNDISCKACGSKSVQTNYSQKSSGQTSRNSTPPLQSRTSSNNDWDNAVPSGRKFLYNSYQYALGDDGLVPLRSDVQDRLNQIIEEHKKKEDFLNTRLQILIKQVCHKCSHENDRQDDNSSVVESVCSVGEGQASAVESSCSDMSWEALENTESPSARWVPDHAVSHCNRCNKAFWFAKRKHHCRKCGNIFCADCSKNSTPLPSEQLFQPVRVCCWCYSELRRDDIPDQCKQDNSQPTNNNPQITASSN